MQFIFWKKLFSSKKLIYLISKLGKQLGDFFGDVSKNFIFVDITYKAFVMMQF